MFESILIAIITSIIAYLSLIISKENKVSDFRQLWVNELRTELSELHGVINYLFVKLYDYKNNGKIDTKSFISENAEQIANFSRIKQKIVFRLNIGNDSYFIECLDDVFEAFQKKQYLSNRNELEKILRKLDAYAHKTLKSEWERVKRGEKWFRITKVVFTGILLLIAIGIAISSFIYISSNFSLNYC